MIYSERLRPLTGFEVLHGPVVYWMSRDQRVHDNWAMIVSQQKALELKVPMEVVFCLVPAFLGATARQYRFMVDGLKQVEADLKKLNIPFRLLIGAPEVQISAYLKRIEAGLLISDFDPLRIKKEWKKRISSRIHIPFIEVDAHNVIPCWTTSDKQEFAAYTIRPKIEKRLFEFLSPFPEMQKHPFSAKAANPPPNNWERVEKTHRKMDDGQEGPFRSGEKEALGMLNRFIAERLNHYAADRNDPTKHGISDLSPYLHFGQISAQRVALEIQDADANVESKDAFLEELIVRREISDNFCHYNAQYDQTNGFPDWAKKTIAAHRRDKRDFLYSLEQFEQARTHEALWNACQMEMVNTGKMHGYMRMYWAKKILEWTASAEEALEIAITLNDRYELDGRDPNGYTGIAWAIGGVHDRAWFERPVFGKIRYMNENGARKKFDVDLYIRNQLNDE